MHFRHFLMSTALAFLMLPLGAIAGPCDAYFPFDGNLNDTAGSGLNGQFVDSSGEPVAMAGEFVPGKVGQALRLNGETIVFSELDLQTETCPQVSVTGWIFLENFPKNSHTLMSTGFGRGPRLVVSSSNLSAHGGSNEIRAGLAVRPGIWIFIAGVWDYTTGTHQIYWRHRSMEEPLGENNRPPQEGLWIGAYAYGSSMQSRANGILIDDLKVHGKALTEEDVHEIRDAGRAGGPGCNCGGAASPIQTNVPPASLETPFCSTDSNCSGGGGFTGACYSLNGDTARCYQRCDSDSDCAAGISCLSVTLPAGTLDGICSNNGVSANPGSLVPGTVLATGPAGSSDTVTDILVERANENRPPDITYDSEEEGIAAAEAAEARRQQEQGPTEDENQGAEQMPAPVRNAVFDLQSMEVTRQHENRGDEYYLVAYKLRGRRGEGDRIYTFDYAKQVWPIQSGRNWAKQGLDFAIPQAAGRLVFEDLAAFEIYGFVALLMEEDESTVQKRTYAYGFGEFQNETGVTEVLSSAFERAVPRTAARPDYGDTSCDNVDAIFTENTNGLISHFGNYNQHDRGLPKAIQDAIREPMKGVSPDQFDGVFWSFYMNAPGIGRCAEPQLAPTMFPEPSGPMEFRTESTRIIGEHTQYE